MSPSCSAHILSLCAYRSPAFRLQRTLCSVIISSRLSVCPLALTSEVGHEMGVPAHQGPRMHPVCVCVCAHSLQCPVSVCVCVCLDFSIVGGLSAGAAFFPPVQCFVGGAFGWLQQQQSQSFPPDMQIVREWAGQGASPSGTLNALTAGMEVHTCSLSSVRSKERTGGLGFGFKVV